MEGRINKNATIVVALLLVTGAIIAAVVYYVSAIRAAQTAEATASEGEVKRGDDDTILRLSTRQDRAPSKAVLASMGSMNDYPAGRQLRVCYDHDNESSVRVEEGPCG